MQDFNSILLIMYLDGFSIIGYYIWYYWKNYRPWFNIFPIMLFGLFSNSVGIWFLMKFMPMNMPFIFYWFCHFCIAFTVNKPFMLLFDKEVKIELNTDKEYEAYEIEEDGLPPLGTDTYATDSEGLKRKQEQVRENLKLAEKLIKDEIGK